MSSIHSGSWYWRWHNTYYFTKNFFGGGVYTFDFDKTLNPDFFGDLRDIGVIVNNLKVDCILCCQVLEHLEYKYLDKILEQFALLSKNIIISVPYCRIPLCGINIKLPKRKYATITMSIPKFYKRFTFNGEHYWELGTKSYSKKKFISHLTKYFTLLDKYCVPEFNYHLFFILKSKMPVS